MVGEGWDWWSMAGIGCGRVGLVVDGRDWWWKDGIGGRRMGLVVDGRDWWWKDGIGGRWREWSLLGQWCGRQWWKVWLEPARLWGLARSRTGDTRSGGPFRSPWR